MIASRENLGFPTEGHLGGQGSISCVAALYRREKMGRDRNTESRLLAQLYLAADGDLEKVRKRYIDRSSTVEPERLKMVRSMLEALVDAMHRDDERAWGQVEQAASALTSMQDGAPLPRPVEQQPAPASATAVSPLPASPQPAASAEEPPAAPWATAPAAPKIEVQAPAPVSNMTVGTKGAPSARPLPFQGQVATPSSVVASEPNPRSGSTAALSGGAPGSHLAAPVPFGGGDAVPTLTIQQYAQLWGRLDAEPGKRAEIYAMYNIADDEMRGRLDAEWKTKLDADATTMKLFVQLRQRIREQILKG